MAEGYVVIKASKIARRRFSYIICTLLVCAHYGSVALADGTIRDKSFVTEMDRNHDDALIVPSTVDLAHNLGLKVIAEGVETGAVWSRLQSLGCDTGQGYFFARPIPVEVLAEWMRTSAWGLPLDIGRQGGGCGSGRMATQLQGN